MSNLTSPLKLLCLTTKMKLVLNFYKGLFQVPKNKNLAYRTISFSCYSYCPPEQKNIFFYLRLEDFIWNIRVILYLQFYSESEQTQFLVSIVFYNFSSVFECFYFYYNLFLSYFCWWSFWCNFELTNSFFFADIE